MVYKKLLDVQKELKCNKSQYNAFGKYSYRNAEDIMEALKPLLAKYEVSLFLSDDLVMIGERYYVKATATLIDAEDGTQTTNTAFAREDENRKGMNSDQLTGATSSYARKYALNGLFLIDDSKDSDTTNDHGKGAPSSPSAPPAPAAKKEYGESETDKKFQEVWDKLSDDQRKKIGEKYPGKFGPQTNPKYFKKSEKEEILSKLSKTS